MADHWLVGVSKQAGLSVDSLHLQPGTESTEAWERVVQATGASAGEIAEQVAKRFRLPIADLESVSPAALLLLPEYAVRRYGVLPLQQSDREIHVATSDPMNMEVEQALAFMSARTPQFEIAPPSALHAAIDRYYGSEAPADPVLRAAEQADTDTLALVVHTTAEAVSSAVAGARGGESSAVAKLTNIILSEALRQRASRVRVGAVPSGGLVTFTIDGVARRYMQLPVPAMNRVIGRLQVLARIGAGERAEHESRPIQVKLGKTNYTVRVRLLGSDRGKVMELRLRPTDHAPLLEELGVPAVIRGRVQTLMTADSGLVLVAAPQREGLTTLLYALARSVADPATPVSMVLDETEEPAADVKQIVLDPDDGLTGARAIENAVADGARVIVMARVWGPESLRAACEAATDRLVLIGVPLASATSACAHLLEHGLAGAALADVFRGAITQRLVRRLCSRCSRPVEQQQPVDGVAAVMRAPGCEECHHTGFHGVLPAIQLVETGDAVKEAIRAGNLDSLEAAAEERSLLELALDHVRVGETTPEEVERVFGPRREAGQQVLRILVADDDPEIRLVARATLESGGFAVDDAEDGQEALERLAMVGQYALIVLDLDMPEVGGSEVLRRAKGDVRTAGIPIVVLTGLADPGLEVQLLEDGAADYIRKPVDPPRFLARVRAALKRQTA